MTWTKEREDKVRKAARSAAGVSRGVALEILSWLDTEREARQRAEQQRDEARAQLEALRVAAEGMIHAWRVLVSTGMSGEDASDVHDGAVEALDSLLADTAGAAREQAAADARAVERIRARGEVEGDHCYPGQPAREAAWADRALESEARQAERDAVALTDAEAYEIVASVRGRRER